ncbi:MAG: transporter substrate-binding protein [Frankiales bacterium]|nr:transporter substrate-binding protein [Frankiales bacterium]
MKTSSAGIKLIIFMVVTSLMTFTLAATIGNFGGGTSTTYHAEFTDVTGLLPGQEVRIAGVKVGKVQKIALAPEKDANCDNKGQRVADVTLTIEGGRKLTSSNQLALRYRNLVGERYVAITEGVGSGSELKKGATVCVVKDGVTMTRPALDLTVLFNGFRPLFTALDPKTINEVSYEIVQTLQGEGGTIDTLLQRTASLTTTLANKDAVIGRVVNNLTTVLDTVDKRDTDLDNLVTQLRRLSEGFAGDRQTIGQSIVGIGNLTDATAGLLAGIRPGVRSDVQQLGSLAKNLNDSKDVINGVLQRLPDKLNRIIATATYGSWFNFYLCGAEVNGVQVVNSAARCQK